MRGGIPGQLGVPPPEPPAKGGASMQGRPRLKSMTVHSAPGQLIVWPRALKRIFIEDGSGCIAAILQLLAAG